MTYDEWADEQRSLADDPRCNCCRRESHHTDIETALKDCPECEAEPPTDWSKVEI